MRLVWRDGVGEDGGQGSQEVCNFIDLSTWPRWDPSPGTARKGTSAISLRAFLFCLEVNYFPFGKLVNIKRWPEWRDWTRQIRGWLLTERLPGESPALDKLWLVRHTKRDSFQCEGEITGRKMGSWGWAWWSGRGMCFKVILTGSLKVGSWEKRVFLYSPFLLERNLLGVLGISNFHMLIWRKKPHGLHMDNVLL